MNKKILITTDNPALYGLLNSDLPYGVQCKSSKGFGQMRHKNKRGFQVPNTLFQMFKQPLMSNYTFYADALYFS